MGAGCDPSRARPPSVGKRQRKRDPDRFKERHAAERKFAHRYRPAPAGPCVYCGASFRIGRDHVPPISQAATAPASARFLLYPACLTCNRALGVARSLCLLSRARIVRRKLAARLEREAVARLRARFGLRGPSAKLAKAERLDLAERLDRINARLQDGSTGYACRCGYCGNAAEPLARDPAKAPGF